MVDFSDVMQFAQTHRPCGGVTPAVRPEPSGGYLLHLACACGAIFDRRVTAHEAAHVPFGSSATAPPAAAQAAPTVARAQRSHSARPRPTPSPELERAMQEALAAEAAPADLAPPIDREPPRITSSQALEDVLREALAAEDNAAAAPLSRASSSASAPAPRRPVAPMPASHVQDTVKAALREHDRLRGALTPTAAQPRRRSRARWLGVAVLVVIVAGGAAFYVAETLEPEAPASASSSAALSDPSPASEAPTYGNAVIALRRLQAASIPTTSLPAYETQVSAAQAMLGRYLEVEAPPEAKSTLRAILDLHLLAITAWRLRAIDTPQAWDPVSRSASLELCEPAKNAAYMAERPGQNTAQTRGRAIAGSIPLLWECAARRLAQLDAAR
jgi:hypothetical protein